MHGGSVTAFSQGLDQGSEFVVRLPLAVNASAVEKPPAKARSTPRFAQHRIMVVDDNEDAADSLGMLLNFLGAEVSVAIAGRLPCSRWPTAIRRSCCWTSECPRSDGYELAQRVREHRGISGRRANRAHRLGARGRPPPNQSGRFRLPSHQARRHQYLAVLAAIPGEERPAETYRGHLSGGQSVADG